VVDPDGKGYAVVGRGSILWLFSVFIQCGENDAQAVFCRVQYVVLSVSLYSKAFLHLWCCGCIYVFILVHTFMCMCIFRCFTLCVYFLFFFFFARTVLAFICFRLFVE